MLESLSRRWPFFAISALGLAIGLWGMQGLPGLSVPPPGYPMNPIVYPARIGPAVVGSSAELRFIAQSHPAGSMMEVRSDAGVLRARLEPQLTRFHFWLILLSGLAFFAVNLLVFAPRVDRGPVRDFYWCTLLFGIATMINGLYFPRSPVWSDWLFPAVWIVCLTALPVFFFRMTQTFPRPRKLLEKRPRIMRGLWIAAGILVVWQIAAVFRYFLDPQPGAWRAMTIPRSLADVFLIGGICLGCLTLFRSGRKLELAREREQTKWLLWGFAIGATPYVLLRTLPKLLGVTSLIPPEVDRVLELAIPVAFTFAIVRYRFLDIDIIIRRSLIYGTLAAALAAVYLLVDVVVAQQIGKRFPQYSGFLDVIAVALPVILYTPTRRWIGTWVDRTFFKIQFDYARALLAFQDAMRGAPGQEEIVDHARRFLDEELVLETVLVMARRGDSLVTAGGPEGVDPATLLQATTADSGTRRLLAAPNSTSRPDLETSPFPPELKSAGFRLALPLSDAEGATYGAILLGEKASERRFIEEDLRLLVAVRSEVAQALERVELVQRAAHEALAREKAEELERLKSDFFSRVAHDLRTPLTSIRWTVQNLLDGVRSAPSSEQMPQLQAVSAAASQLGRLVNNLLDLSRLEHPSARGEHVRVDLVPLVQEAVATVQPVARARNIRFEVSVASSVGPVRGDRGQLLEIVMNLLENAMRFSPDGESVDVTLERNGEGQTVSVRDHGPGIPANEFERIFERFEQGKPSPYTKEQGFGLGLYVAKSYAELMHGSIRAGNHPDGGARFVCTIPEWKSA